MRQSSFLAILAMVVPALAGCPSSPYMTMGQPLPLPQKPMPYPTSNPMGFGPGYPSPAPLTGDMPAPIMVMPQQLLADGPSMDDAFHLVQRYVSLHYAGAELAAVRSAQIGPPGRIARTGSWSFTYRMVISPTATGSTSTQAVEIPSQFEGRQLTFAINGNQEILAPEVKEKSTLQAIDYARVLPLSKILEICQGFGMATGPAGVSVVLESDALKGPYYEIDNSIGFQWIGPNPGPYNSGSIDQRAPYGRPAYGLGKYRIDALTGALLERMTAQ